MLFSLYSTFVLVDIHFHVRVYSDRSRERRRRYSRSSSRERMYRRGPGVSGNSPDLYDNIIEPDYQHERDKWVVFMTRSFGSHFNNCIFRRYNNRNDRGGERRGRDKDRYYHRGRGHSSESSNDSFNGWDKDKLMSNGISEF